MPEEKKSEEKFFTIPLRREFRNVPGHKRSARAVSTVKSFLTKHLKVKDVKVGKHLNLKLTEHGGSNPPSAIKIKTLKEGDIVRVELIDFPFEEKPKEEEKKGLKEKILGKKEEKEEPSKTEEEKEQELVKEGKVEEKHTKQEQKPVEKHEKEHKEEATQKIKEKLREKKVITRGQKAKLKLT